jgi:hypothetical protein
MRCKAAGSHGSLPFNDIIVVIPDMSTGCAKPVRERR